jgi:hypothetical protein
VMTFGKEVKPLGATYGRSWVFEAQADDFLDTLRAS